MIFWMMLIFDVWDPLSQFEEPGSFVDEMLL